MRQLIPGQFAVVPCKSVEGMDPYCQTVYMWLCSHANESNQCWPSVATLMAKSGIKSRSKVQESIKILTETGLVKKDERREDGVSSSNLYEVFYDDNPVRNTSPYPSAIRTTPVRNAGTELKPLELKPETQETHVADATSSDLENAFESFWSRYPRKIGKGQARKAFFAAVKKHDPRDIAKGFGPFLESCVGQEERFIPHASTWLNGERWLDQPEKPKEYQSYGF